MSKGLLLLVPEVCSCLAPSGPTPDVVARQVADRAHYRLRPLRFLLLRIPGEPTRSIRVSVRRTGMPKSPSRLWAIGRAQGIVREMLIILRGRLRAAQYGEQVGLLEDQENRRPDLDDFGRRIHNVQEKHGSALNRFREQGRTLPGLADERLRAFPAALEPEPFLIEEGEDADLIAERAFLRGIQQLGIIGVMRSALAGQQLDAGERDVSTRAVSFLRSEADRLHEEVVQRLSRGEGESRIRQSLISIGRGSLNVGRIIAVAAITTIVGLLIGAYFAKWLPGQNDHPKPAPTAPTTTTTP